MKQKNLLTTMLLLFALIVGSMNAWADPVTGTIVFGTNNTKINDASVTANDSQGNSWTITTVGTSSFTANASYYQVGSSNKPATSITFTTTLSDDVKFTAFSAKFGGFNSTAGTVTLKVDDTTVGTGSLNAANDVTVSATSEATGKTLTVTVTGISKGVKCYNISYTYEPAGPADTRAATTTTISVPDGFVTDIAGGTDVNAGTLTATVVSGEVTLTNPAIEWESTNTDVASVDASTGAVTLKAVGTTTIKAKFVGDNDYQPSAGSYELTVTDSYAKGGLNNPYTVAEAIAATPSSGTSANVYIKGVVKKFFSTSTSIMGDGINYRYYICDKGVDNELLIYRGTLNGKAFSSADDLLIGDEVVVYGGLTTYQSDPEVAAGNDIVSLVRPSDTDPSITVDTYAVEAPADGADGILNVTYKNITNVNADVYFCDANGDAATYDWIIADINGENNVEYEIGANEGEARTAYMKVYALDDDANDVYSELITITQAKMTLDYTTLPFAFDSGRNAIKDIEGLTQEGLGTDYNSSPKLKFDHTDDYVVLHFNERPGILTFDIKGNSFSGGTFTVQTSEDGVTYTDLKTYTSLGNTQTEKFENLGENVRYIKWIYTEKVSGNVALGDIALAKYMKLPASITVDKDVVEASADGADGTITVTYNNITTAIDAHVYFCDANGDAATYNWITADINGENNVEYEIGANEGEARTAYMMVHALDDEANDVYSELITFTQAKAVVPAVNMTYTLATTITPGKKYVIASGTEDAVSVMADQKSNNRGVAKGTVSGATLNVSSDAGAAEFVIYGPDASGMYTIYDPTENGYLYAAASGNNYLRTQGTNNVNGKWEITFDEGVASIVASNSSNRNVMQYNSSSKIFSCYVSDSQAPVFLYESTDATTVPTTTTVKLNGNGYATFATTDVLDFLDAEDADFSAWQITGIDNDKINFEQITSTVAAGKGILLKGAANAEVMLNILPAGGDVLTNNLLEGIISATEVNSGEYYGLSGNKFVSVNAGTVPAGKALLPASEVPSEARQLTFVFEGETTGISASLNDKAEMANEKFYNLAGQRVAQPTKGLYIMNGKKVMFK